jgi:GH25 family lysozyme M1 (1,4-beta-N-acetylmuramidase)
MTYAVGEDRSDFQPVESWDGDSFGFAKATEGTGWTDPTFPRNWANLKAEGLVRGAYHFFHPALSAAGQAEFFVGHVRANGGFGPGDIFIADVEITAGGGGEQAGTGRCAARMHSPYEATGVAAEAVGGLAREFLTEVAALVGPYCPVLLYSDLTMATSDLADCAGFPLFVADYIPNPPGNVAPWKGWTFWQHEAGGGRGGGDSDYFCGTTAELRAWVGSYGNWTEALVDTLPTLQLGSRDEAGGTWFVHRLQNDVAAIGRWNGLGAGVTGIADDGVFGAATEAAVKAVQRHYSLTEDGICGPATWTRLIAG